MGPFEVIGRRLRVPALWALIVCVLGAGIAAWAVRRGADDGATNTASRGPNGMLVPTPSEASTVAPGAPGTVAVGGTTTSTARSGPVRVAAGPGAVTVTWDPIRTRPAVQSYVVRATEEGAGDRGTLITCPSCTSATFRGLTNGKRYTFSVAAATSSGNKGAIQSPVAIPGSDLCPGAQACVAIDGGSTRGTAATRLQGFLHGIDGLTDRNRVAALRPQTWRGSAGRYWHTLVGPYGPETTEVISDSWLIATYDKDKGGAAAPWEDWDTYRSFVKNLVTKAANEGWSPTYWEILNEPEAGLPYRTGQGSIANTLLTYLNGYQAIKEADAHAKVVGPGTMFTIERLPNHPELIDLTTFLDFADAHNMRFDALSWHETGPDHLQPFDRLPDSIQNHVDRVRNELFRWPNIGKPQIFVNEYGVGRSLGVPGWRVAYLAALENAGVDSGNTSCWALDNTDASSCSLATLGGLLDKDRSTPRASYWVHRAYSDMRGTRLDASTSVPFLSAFAVAQGQNGPWELLLGRHQSCTSPVNPLCEEPASAVPAAIPVTVALRVGGPDRAIVLAIQRIPDATGPMPDAPPTESRQIVVRGGVARFVTPAFADGEAYVLRLG
jgi:hypothetical protein